MRKIMAVVAAALSAPVLTAQAGSFTPLHTFAKGTDGAYVTGLPLVVGNTLFGATSEGGNTGCQRAGCGTIYAIDLATNTETVLHRFDDDRINRQYGYTPQGGLTMVGSLLYGAARFGSVVKSSKPGLLFTIDPGTGIEQVVYNFDKEKLGSHGVVTNGFTPAQGLLFGTVLAGRDYVGFVYKFDPATAELHVLYDLPKNSQLNSPITVDSTASHLWGTTANQLFALTAKTRKVKMLYTFNRLRPGYAPIGSMTLFDNTLYGADQMGGRKMCQGVYECGTLFRFDLAANKMTVAHYFNGGRDGADPTTGPTLLNGILYGTTNAGGANNNGTIYAYDPSSGVETVVYSMPADALGGTNSGLTTDGIALYGSYGGGNGNDVVFKFVP